MAKAETKKVVEVAASPPRPNKMLLGVSIVLWCAWIVFLIWLAWKTS